MIDYVAFVGSLEVIQKVSSMLSPICIYYNNRYVGEL